MSDSLSESLTPCLVPTLFPGRNRLTAEYHGSEATLVKRGHAGNKTDEFRVGQG
jgi:hypothetical protein